MRLRKERVPSRTKARVWLVLGTGLLQGCVYAAGRPPARQAGLCEVREVARDLLEVEDGLSLYVHPGVLEPNGRGDLLLAGDISFMSARGADSVWRPVRQDSTFGVILPRAGEPIPVRSPVRTRLLAAVRAVGRPDGTWSVLFAETPEYTGDSPPDSAARLWHGVLDAGRWSPLEPIPLPPGGAVRHANAAAPLLRGDTLFWALAFRGEFHDVAVFSRRGGAWTHEVVPTRFAAFYPRLAYSDTLGLVLASVGGDPELRHSGNNLLLWARRPGWRLLSLLVPAARGSVHDPWISLEPGAEVVSWAADRVDGGPGKHARLMRGEPRPQADVTLLDSAISGLGAYPVRPLGRVDGPRWWVVEHLSQHTLWSEVRVLQEANGALVVRATAAAPFVMGFASAMPDPASILVAGGFFSNDRSQRLASLLVKFAVRCP